MDFTDRSQKTQRESIISEDFNQKLKTLNRQKELLDKEIVD